MNGRRLARLVTLAPLAILAMTALGVAVPGCTPDAAPDGVQRATKYPGGPTITFDLTKKPIPDLPLPNDVATISDPTSRTGLRLNVSAVAPTSIERHLREKLSTLEGWGTFAPISIPFDKPLDVEDIKKRHQDDDYDFQDDTVYLVNLATGVPVPLDLGGNFPVTLKETARYWPNDPLGSESNLLFETREEDRNGNGRLDPGEDTDFDGVLDHPNFPGRKRPDNGVDGLLGFFESETNTLLLRPMLPLDEMTEYAVVVTDRLHGTDPAKTPVQSPFDYIHHPSQRSSTERLVDALSRRYQLYGFGNAADALRHVQFVFTFTTQPTVSDTFALRDGVYGQGKYGWLATDYPAKVTMLKASGVVDAGDPAGDPKGTFTCTDDSATCKACQEQTSTSRYVGKYGAAAKETFQKVVEVILGEKGPAGARLLASLDNVSYLAVGTMKVPWLLGDVKDVSPEASITLDPQSAEIPHSTDTLGFFVVVPKTTITHKPPFPVALYGHGYGGNGTEALLFAGEMARHGIVTIGMNAPGHGLELDEGGATLAKTLLGSACLKPLASGFMFSRVRDLDGDGKLSRESGADFWTSYLFHTRDMVRQAVVEQIMMVKAMRAFDGTQRYDWKGDGSSSLAGDFDEDGVVDFGGPDVSYYAWGESLGGVLSAIQGGVDTNLAATAPVAGGGALTDIGVRSFQGGVVEAVQLRLMSPLVISVPAESRFDYQKDDKGNPITDEKGKPIALPPPEQTKTRCAPGQRSIRYFVVELNAEREIEIGCAGVDELDTGMDVVVENLDSGEQRCAQMTTLGSNSGDAQFRIGIPASLGDRLQLAVWKPTAGKPSALRAYGKDCQALEDSKVTKELRTFDGIGDGKCLTDASDPKGCIATIGGRTYPYGARLVSVADGYGVKRQTPELRKLLTLGQIILEPADPVTYAPYYYVRPRLDPFGKSAPPTAILTINTVGDMNAPVSAGITSARVHGAIPFLRPENAAASDYADYVAPQKLIDLLGGKTPNRVLLDDHVIEGIARLGRHPAGETCAPNVNLTISGCTGDASFPSRTICDDALFDPENLSENTISIAPQTMKTPLRLARIAKRAGSADLNGTWGPRLAAWTAQASPLGATLQPFLRPDGAHGFDPPDPCKKWDDGSYLLGTLAHFFASKGTDLWYLSHPVTEKSTPTTDHRCAAVTDPASSCAWGD